MLSLNGEWVPDASIRFAVDKRSLYPALSMSGLFAFNVKPDAWRFAPPTADYEAWTQTGPSIITRPGTAKAEWNYDVVDFKGAKVKEIDGNAMRCCCRSDKVGDLLASTRIVCQLTRDTPWTDRIL